MVYVLLSIFMLNSEFDSVIFETCQQLTVGLDFLMRRSRQSGAAAPLTVFINPGSAAKPKREAGSNGGGGSDTNFYNMNFEST